MAFAHAVSAIPSTCWLCRSTTTSSSIDYSSNIGNEDHRVSVLGVNRESPSSGIGISRASIGWKWRRSGNFTCRWRLSAVDTHIIQNAPSRATIVEIPVTCYQLIGVTNRAEKDEIVKSVMDLKNAEIEEGYSMDVVVSRRDLLMDVRDKLLFEQEYAGNIKEKIPPKCSLRVPWAWLPGGLCLLQEVGEVKLVLEIGRAALQCPDAKPYIHDLLLSMALAECATAKIAFEKNKVSQGFEALARARCLLLSKKSLEELTLLSQIEESLEELAPACTLELLGMANLPENSERRRGAISALRELLRQGLDVEASCQVQDWPSFLSQALSKLMAIEIVDLLPWEDLAVIRKNKKSLESQNQRVVVDFSCFYRVLLAHIAVGFSSKLKELINKSKTICECLIASEGIDLKLEEAFCLFFLGQGNKSEVIEKLQQLESNSNPASQSSISGKDFKDTSGTNQLLETWLKESVLSTFPDTRDCSPSLVNFFNAEKKTCGIKKSIGALQTMSSVSRRPIANTRLSERGEFEASHSCNSSQHLGTAIKQLAPIDLQSSLILEKNNSASNASASSGQFKRSLGMDNKKVWENWLARGFLIERFTSVAVLGCILFATFRLTNMNVKGRSASKCIPSNSNTHTSAVTWTGGYSIDNNVVPSFINGKGVSGRLKKLLAMLTKQYRNTPDAGEMLISHPAASLSSSMPAVYRTSMPIEEAEELVNQWQAIKAEALGPNHQVHSLSEILDESMLVQWHDLADAAKARSCYWRFVLLQLSVLRAEILSDEAGAERAEIEALLEEAAELVDKSEQKNPSYYSTYKIRYVLKMQDDGSWRFCEGELQKS